MDLVTSADGTPIAVWRGGSGPPLLLVHGMTASHATTWPSVRPRFERRFTVFAMDRRGRGGSGAGPGHSLRREAEDIAAVVGAIGDPVDVLGHSYGALCALEAALLTDRIRRLVLYEGVPLRGADGYPPGALQRLEARVEAGDLEGALLTLYRDIARMPAAEIELLRSAGDAWALRLANASALPREVRADAGYVFDPDRFRALAVPTLLLVGEESPAAELESAVAVARALQEARVAVLPGQGHAAMHTAPELFAREVEGLLLG